MTAAINGAFTSVTTVATMTDLSQMLAYDALWVDQRWQTTAAPEEIENMMAYAATGRRVVVMGENATWGRWNSQVLSALGGMEGPLDGFPGAGCMYGPVAGLGTNALTAGVRAVSLACGGYAIGGTQLFAYNVATLWRAEQNVLTILDGNIMDDLFAAYDAALFRTRVISWLAASPTDNEVQIGSLARMSALSVDGMGSGAELVALDESISLVATPEPSTVGLVVAGLAVIGASRRRRSPRSA
jgi:hypothetical protein